MTKFEAKIVFNPDRQKDDYHIYIDGDYLITCQTLKEVALLRNGMKERK